MIELPVLCVLSLSWLKGHSNHSFSPYPSESIFIFLGWKGILFCFDFRLYLKEIISGQRVESSVLYWLTRNLMIREYSIYIWSEREFQSYMTSYTLALLSQQCQWSWLHCCSLYKAFPWGFLLPVTDQARNQPLNLKPKKCKYGGERGNLTGERSE